MISATYTFSEDFLRGALLQHQRTTVSRKVLTAVKAVCLACLIAIGVLLLSKWELVGALIFAGFSLLLILSRRIDLFYIGRRLRRSPYWNKTVVFEFDSEGVRVVSDLSTSFVKWTGYTRAISMSSGFLLYQGPDAFTWLPSTSFVQPAQIDDFRALLKSQIVRFEEQSLTRR